MPQATDLVIKNGSNVDKTFVLISPSAGDGSIAEWALKEGAISSVFPRLTFGAQKVAKGRNAKLKLKVPSSYNDAVTGLTNVGSAAEFNATYSLPADFPENKKDDYIAFVVGAVQSALLKACGRDAVNAN